MGHESGAASSQLLDDLIEHRAERAGAVSPSSSPSLQHVVACTGASPVHASKILQLKDEISRLRAEGHSTANVIDALQRRLRDGGEGRSVRWLWCPGGPPVHAVGSAGR